MRRYLTDTDAGYMRAFADYFTTTEIAAEYGVHYETVRSVLDGRSHTGNPRKHRCDRGYTWTQAREVWRIREETGFGARRISRMTGVSLGAVGSILKGESYQDARPGTLDG